MIISGLRSLIYSQARCWCKFPNYQSPRYGWHQAILKTKLIPEVCARTIFGKFSATFSSTVKLFVSGEEIELTLRQSNGNVLLSNTSNVDTCEGRIASLPPLNSLLISLEAAACHRLYRSPRYWEKAFLFSETRNSSIVTRELACQGRCYCLVFMARK